MWLPLFCVYKTHFFTHFSPIIRGCVLYTELEIQDVLHRAPKAHGDQISMTRHYRTPYQNTAFGMFSFQLRFKHV